MEKQFSKNKERPRFYIGVYFSHQNQTTMNHNKPSYQEKPIVEEFLRRIDQKILESLKKDDKEGLELFFLIREGIISRLSEISKTESFQRTWEDYKS